MRSAGGQRDELIAGSDSRSIDDVIFFNNPDAETGEIVIIPFIHAGHFCGLAANQRTTCQFATRADAGHDVCRHIHIELARGIVVEEQ